MLSCHCTKMAPVYLRRYCVLTMTIMGRAQLRSASTHVLSVPRTRTVKFFRLTMDMKKMKDEEKLDLCRKYYLGGFALLPFLWFINTIWFFREAFCKETYPKQKQIKTYVIRSFIGALIWSALICLWIVIFQLNRVEWGATADHLSFIIPKGIP